LFPPATSSSDCRGGLQILFGFGADSEVAAGAATATAGAGAATATGAAGAAAAGAASGAAGAFGFQRRLRCGCFGGRFRRRFRRRRRCFGGGAYVSRRRRRCFGGTGGVTAAVFVLVHKNLICCFFLRSHGARHNFSKILG